MPTSGAVTDKNCIELQRGICKPVMTEERHSHGFNSLQWLLASTQGKGCFKPWLLGLSGRSPACFWGQMWLVHRGSRRRQG